MATEIPSHISTAWIAGHRGVTQRTVERWIKEVEAVCGSVRTRGRIDTRKLLAIDPEFFVTRVAVGADAPGTLREVSELRAELKAQGERLALVEKQLKGAK